MKIGIIGVGAVGSACALSLIQRGSCREIVLVDKDNKRANAVAMDMQYSTPLAPMVDIMEGDYEALTGAELVIITAGVNEASGGATDRNDSQGRLRLLNTNADAYRNIVPQIVKHAPDATIMVVTDPPDPLADLTRKLAGHERVFSTGTMVDSLRFRVHLAQRLQVQPSDVEALVVGEHGVSEVPLWSSAAIAGIPVLDILRNREKPVDEIQALVEEDIRYANINIIEGSGASQYGIGAISARLAEVVLRNEQALFPVAAYNHNYGATLSLPSVLGKDGVQQMLEPHMTKEEREALEQSAEKLRDSVSRIL